MEQSLKTSGNTHSASTSASSLRKEQTYNQPRMLTPFEVESLRRSKKEISSRAKAELNKQSTI
jgi:hypothetical protein